MSDDELTTIAVWTWAACIVVVILFLTGCSPTFTGICGVQPLGNESGIAFVAVHCEEQK